MMVLNYSTTESNGVLHLHRHLMIPRPQLTYSDYIAPPEVSELDHFLPILPHCSCGEYG